ncbi:MAG: hypothetical protein GXP39_15545 [Chloroflexi bacterium]|nr:hypothetical protein [Chloroflexota bacterium]
MARATRMGADIATREANRAQMTGHVCATCGKPIKKGELLMVTTTVFSETGRIAKRLKTPYHRNGSCFKTS